MQFVWFYLAVRAAEGSYPSVLCLGIYVLILFKKVLKPGLVHLSDTLLKIIKGALFTHFSTLEINNSRNSH